MKTTERCLCIIETLAGYEHAGLTNKDLAAALGINPSVSHRDLTYLESIGYTERLASNTKLWRNSPRLTRISTKVQQGYSSAIDKVEELNQRHTRI